MKEKKRWVYSLQLAVPCFELEAEYEITDLDCTSDAEHVLNGFSAVTGKSVRISELAKGIASAEMIERRVAVCRLVSGHPGFPRLVEI